MPFQTYEEARAALQALNAEAAALKAPKFTAPTADHDAYNASVRALKAEADAAGFIRIFDGSFKLSNVHMKLPAAGDFPGGSR